MVADAAADVAAAAPVRVEYGAYGDHLRLEAG